MENKIFDKKMINWNDSLRFLFLIQKRLFKSVYVGDLKTALSIQKLIIRSNSSRLLAIRYVTQVCVNRKIPGIDGKNSLTFVERFELNEFLRLNAFNWFPQQLRTVSLLKNDTSVKSFKLSTISDRVWQFLIKLALEPVHEALFHPRNIGFRSGCSIFEVQNIIYLNLFIKSNGVQKRLLIFDLKNCFVKYNISYLLTKIIALRSIKICLNRLFSIGFMIQFPDDITSVESYDLSSLLSNILLNGIELLHNSIRFGFSLIFFLKPEDDEKKLINLLCFHLDTFGLLSNNLSIRFISGNESFDFLDWNFKLLRDKSVYITPSNSNYQKLLLRLKRIINNSNFGSAVKANKIYPIIKYWRLYHKFSSLTNSRFSLFFIKKRAFKMFLKESRQDFYSTKRLLDRSFYVLSDLDKNFQDFNIVNSPYYGHLIFYFNSSNYHVKFSFFRNFFCFHCGMKSVFY